MLTEVRFVVCQTRANRADRSGDDVRALVSRVAYHHAATFMSRSETGPVAEPTLLVDKQSCRSSQN